MIAINPKAFIAQEEFQARAREFIEQVKSSRKVPGVEKIMAPGEPEQKTRERRLREGVPIVDEVWTELEQIAKELGVDLKSLKGSGSPS